MFTVFANATNKLWTLVMTDLADVEGFKIGIQICVWLAFPTLLLFWQK